MGPYNREAKINSLIYQHSIIISENCTNKSHPIPILIIQNIFYYRISRVIHSIRSKYCINHWLIKISKLIIHQTQTIYLYMQILHVAKEDSWREQCALRLYLESDELFMFAD